MCPHAPFWIWSRGDPAASPWGRLARRLVFGVGIATVVVRFLSFLSFLLFPVPVGVHLVDGLA
jgi:hypothetical protein